MQDSMRIGVIGGGGWLGKALANAILNKGVVRHEALALSYRHERPAGFPNVYCTQDNQELAERSDVIIVSVRPADWPSLSVDAHGKLVISVMAGIRLHQLAAHHQTSRVVRALPNAAVEVGRSYTPWIASGGMDEADRNVARRIFRACGVEDEVTGESDIDYLTGLSGSGLAFPALFGAAMMKDAVHHGLSTDIARRAVNTVLIGAGALLEHRDDCPNNIVNSFLDYRGTTAAAIEAMRAFGLEATVSEGLSAAFRKSVSMGDAS
ncbi:pyrroline-5-carboxylate reductase family protein [Rhizobium sullae]|uniref:Pyrroline-5-carboxylate reductase n=1 Tax=Rhizobium sullae TaxID=50338 RepID=A0A4V2V888_RHISU|nr:pyrroline-5-carboxylate reductase dimerization domain-containing protein [Rhizobium sullae]TCU11714.1 pyrroline-5-carboxylate reductase [Rhizobium sullae]